MGVCACVRACVRACVIAGLAAVSPQLPQAPAA